MNSIGFKKTIYGDQEIGFTIEDAEQEGNNIEITVSFQRANLEPRSAKASMSIADFKDYKKRSIVKNSILDKIWY